MIWPALCMSAACAALLTWQIASWLGPAVQRYRARYTHDAGITLGELFLFIDSVRLWWWAITLAILLGGLAFGLTSSLIAAGMAATIAMRLPLLLVTYWRRRRLAKFERQLPAALAALACALRAGSSIPAALRQIVDHGEAPLAQEFGLVLHEQRLGVSFDKALTHLQTRVPSEAGALFVAALRIASHAGGNLAETLDGIAQTLRERMHWQAKLCALTAQGRLQAWIVGALPLVLLGALSYLESDVMTEMWRTPTGWGVLAVLGVLEAGGMLLIRRIVNIDL